MKLYILKPKELGRGTPWRAVYDEARAFIVVANNPAEARRVCADQAGWEGSDAWLKSEHSTCQELRAGRYREPQVIIRDFHAG